MVWLAYAFHTTPSAWLGESDKMIATAVEVLAEVADRLADG